MTSKLKCPFCGAELGKEQGSERWWYCVNAKCVHKYTTTHETIWQALIQAKQDLETATKALENIVSDYEVDASNGWLAANAKKALKQIKHWEYKQKENQ